MTVNGKRLWNSLMDMAQTGASIGGGSNRVELTDEDKEGRELFIGWCRQDGFDVSIDAMGNIFARYGEADHDLPPVVVGSHLDTQPRGGRFDGVYGVLAGLELIRTLKENGVKTRRPIDVAVWTNEEGSRFNQPMLGSRFFTGRCTLEEARAFRDAAGISVGEELNRLGYEGTADRAALGVSTYVEVHIEQGPILYQTGQQIGVVLGVNGISGFDINLEGATCHAATTPIPMRRDALLGAARIIDQVHSLGASLEPNGRASSASLRVTPNVHNVVAGTVSMKADVRHRYPDSLREAETKLQDIVHDTARQTGLSVEMTQYGRSEPIQFDLEAAGIVRDVVGHLGYSHVDIMSGAGHDACNLSFFAPTIMIFIPCKDGLSHNEAEWTEPEDAERGCNVLLNSVLKFAN